MCQKSLKSCCLSPATIKIGKITLLLAVFCFAECAAGACISYGHSCWGAHGKRNGVSNTRMNELIKNDEIMRNPDEGRVLLSRLIQGPRLFKTRDIGLTGNIEKQIDINNSESIKNIQDQLDLTELQDLISDVNGALQEDNSNPRQRTIDKIRFLNYFKKNDEKLN